MAGEHGGCCCNHDDPHDIHEHQEKIVQSPIRTVTEGAGCCGGAKVEETLQSNDHAGHSAEVRSPS